MCPEESGVPGSTQKYPEVPGSTRKYPEVPRSTQKYPEVTGSTQKYPEVPVVKYQNPTNIELARVNLSTIFIQESS